MSGDKVPHFGIYIPGPSRGTADALAATTGLSLADARIALASPIPRRVATAVTQQESEDLAAALQRAGFDAFAVSFDALRLCPPRAKTARFVGTEVEFQPGGSFPIRLVVRGQLESVCHYRTDVVTQAGVTTRKGDVRQDPEPFVCFYGDRVEQAVEIRPYAFNFRFLGADAGISKAQSMKAFLDRIHDLYPTMRVDDTLVRFPLPSEYTDSNSGASIEPSFVGSDTIPASSRLHTLARSSGSTATSRKTESNEKAALRCALLIAMAALNRPLS